MEDEITNKFSDEIINKFSDEKIINFNASRYRLKIVINNLVKPFIIIFQGFNSKLFKTNNIIDYETLDYETLNKIPNYMENTFSQNINYNYIYVTDIYQFWGSLDADNILKSLQNIIEHYKPIKIVCLGQSAGGYMSILFGNLLGVDKILSFVPQINIYTDRMNIWRRLLSTRYADKMKNFKYKNLNILQPFISKTKIYSCKGTKDIIHINNLDKKDTNLCINYISERNTHGIISVLGKVEYIKLIMKELLNI